MDVSPYEIEERVQAVHWWFVVRRKLLESILSSLSLSREFPTIDMGCGVGSNLDVLKSLGLKAIGCDRSLDNLRLAKNKFPFSFVNGDLEKLPFRSSSFELVIATDVLEHLENDHTGVRELCRILRPRGYLIVTVPAFRWLWGTQDVVAGHRRRYTKQDVIEVLRESNFQIAKAFYFNFFLFFPILLIRRFIRLLGFPLRSENEINFPLLNFFLKTIFSLELPLLKFLRFPYGVSILCQAQKK